MKLYHGTSAPGIQSLKARSTRWDNGKNALYLTSNRAYALFYIWDCARFGDYKFVTCGVRDGVVFYEEQFPNQLQTLYAGNHGYLYICEKDDRFERVENREQMFVSPQDAPVLSVEEIDDAYAEILRLEEQGQVRIKRFLEQSGEEQARLTEMIAEYIAKCGLLSQNMQDKPETAFLRRFHRAAWEKAKNFS